MRLREQGFTLIELLVSMAVLTIVMGGLSGVLMLVSRAMPQGDRAASEIERSAALDVLAEDLTLALDKPVLVDDEIRFSVPDRTGDALPEAVAYAIDEATLMRRQNAATPTPMLEGVASLGLTTGTTTSSRATEPSSTINPVLALWSTTRSTVTVHSGATYLQPFLPQTGAADRMRITRIRLHAAQGSFVVVGDPDADQWISVAVHRLDALRTPIAPPIAEVELHPARLAATAQWVDLPTGAASEIETGDWLGILVRTGLDSSRGPVLSRQTSDSDGGAAGSLLLQIPLLPGVWTPVLGNYLVCEVEAELITAGATVSEQLVWTGTASVRFEDGSERSTSARLLSRGEGP